jgi:hypothetical protein
MENKRMVNLSKSLDEKKIVTKTEKKQVDKKKLSEEFKRFSKIDERVDERLNEGAFGAQGGTESARIGANPQSYATGFNQKAGNTNYLGYGKTVNTFLPQQDSTNGIKGAAYLQPKEALNLSIRRTLESGAPIGGLDFYGEVNWNLNNMGFDVRQPIEIKEALKRMFKDK